MFFPGVTLPGLKPCADDIQLNGTTPVATNDAIPASTIEWTEDGVAKSARWRSESALTPPKRVVAIDDRMTADQACRLACEGTGLVWRGDFQNARQMLAAIARRIDKKPERTRKKEAAVPPDTARAFHLYRMARSQRARILGTLLIPFEGDYSIPLSRAPDVRAACREAFGEPDGQPWFCALRELQGVIGAYEWRKAGIEVPALHTRIHPHYGVFAPTRSEYVDLIARAPLPSQRLAFDIGTGTGVLALMLAQRGVAHVIATDIDSRALACARDNVGRLNLSATVEVIDTDLFPPGRAPLLICNPPWLPGKPASSLEGAIYDPGSRMLKAFLNGALEHLEAGGEAWLILSDLAEHLGLRTRVELLNWFTHAGLKVIARTDQRPRHARASDQADLLYRARSAEVSSLWRLKAL